MKGFAWIIAFLFVGETVASWIPAPIPGNVLGLVLLLIALHLNWVKLGWVRETANFLLSHMMLFFAPVIVGTMVFIPEIKAHIWPIVVALSIGTLGVIAISGWLASFLSRPHIPVKGVDDAND